MNYIDSDQNTLKRDLIFGVMYLYRDQIEIKVTLSHRTIHRSSSVKINLSKDHCLSILDNIDLLGPFPVYDCIMVYIKY